MPTVKINSAIYPNPQKGPNMLDNMVKGQVKTKSLLGSKRVLVIMEYRFR